MGHQNEDVCSTLHQQNMGPELEYFELKLNQLNEF